MSNMILRIDVDVSHLYGIDNVRPATGLPTSHADDIIVIIIAIHSFIHSFISFIYLYQIYKDIDVHL